MLAEYSELRKELLQNDAMTQQMLGFVVVFAGTAFTLAFGQFVQNPPLAAAALLTGEAVAIAVSLQTIDRARNTFMKAVYIRTFLEGAALPGLKWESRLHALRLDSPRLGFGRFEGFSGQLWIHGFVIVFTTVVNVALTASVYASEQSVVHNRLLLCGSLSGLGMIGAAWSLVIIARRHAAFVLHHDGTFMWHWKRIC
jgi:hypothetical protein